MKAEWFCDIFDFEEFSRKYFFYAYSSVASNFTEDKALFNHPHMSGIYKQENSVNHLDNPASVSVNNLESVGKVKCFETCVFWWEHWAVSLSFHWEQSLGQKYWLCFIELNTLPFQGDCQLLCDHEKIDFNFRVH